MLPGESTGFQICACFDTQGLERREWGRIDLVAQLSPATDAAYTTDIEATPGDAVSLAEAHLGGSGTGIPITLTNSGGRPLASIPMRVIARDAGGRWIGMAGFGNSVVSFTEDIDIQPGESPNGVLDSEIDCVNGRITCETVAIGSPAR